MRRSCSAGPLAVTEPEIRRHRGLVDDAIGGALTFVIELGIVLALAAAAVAIAAIVLALV